MPPSIQRRELLPQKMTEIADEWWDVVFGGRLWLIDGRVIPVPWRDSPATSRAQLLEMTFEACRKMRDALNYRAKKRALRTTGVIRHEQLSNPDTLEPERVWCLYFQAFDRSVQIKDNRWPREQAVLAPTMPPAMGRPGVGRGGPRSSRPIDMTEVMVRLREAQTGPDAPAASLLTHPQLGWYAERCTCRLLNFRVHESSCPVYPVYEMLERAINRLEISPETWVQRYGRRL